MYQKRIFITGATGLLGSHILRLFLERGYTNIVALCRKSSRMDLVAGVDDRVTWVEGDILDTDLLDTAMKGADWVIHAAALISYENRMQKKQYEVNVDGTMNVVNAALHQGIEKLMHVSSISVFTRTGGEQFINENTEWEPTPFTSHYGLTKHLAELEVRRGEAEGLQVAIINPSIIFGSGFWKEGSTSFFYKGARGLKFYPVGANGIVDVRDVAHMCILRLENDHNSERMIVCGTNSPLIDVFRQIAELMGKPAPFIRLSPAMTEFAWRLLLPYELITGKEPLISKATARTTACKLHFDNARSLSVPGFSYTRLDKTLDDMAKLYRIASKKNFPALPMVFLPHHLS
jgi:nucleoside-diphosphate-sugar epimerase